jgi:hypothetical protein
MGFEGSKGSVRMLEGIEFLRLLPAARGGGGVCGILGRTRRPGSTYASAGGERLRVQLLK